MPFTKVKPGGWAVNEKLTSAQMNQLDTDHEKSVNGVDGDTITGAILFDADITMNASDINVNGGTLTVDAGAIDTVNGATVTLDDTTMQANANCTVDFLGDVGVTGTATVGTLAATTANISGTTTTNNLHVTNAATLDQTLTVAGQTDLAGPTNLSGVTTVVGASNRLKVTQRTVTKVVPAAQVVAVSNGSHTSLSKIQGSAGSTMNLVVPIDIPEGAILDFVEVDFSAVANTNYTITGTIYTRFSGNLIDSNIGTINAAGAYVAGTIVGPKNAIALGQATAHSGSSYWAAIGATFDTAIPSFLQAILTYKVSEYDER